MMNRKIRVRKLLTGIIGATALAYPACAAVCPKGQGSCPYPGKCFLYTDTDANRICDYTHTAESGSGSAQTAPATQAATVQPSSPATAGSTSAAGSVPSAGPAPAVPSDTGTADILHGNALLIGFVLFLTIAAVLFSLFRSGRFGPLFQKTGPALAISSLISLSISEIATYLMMGDAASSAIVYFAALYMLAGTLLTAYLWKEGAMARNATTALAGLAVLFGFILGALIMPAEFIGIAHIATGSQTITVGIAAVCTVLALALIVGRTFCGHICPVGSIQELAYNLPVRKIPVRSTYPLELIRLLVFVSALVAALYAIDIAGLSGSYDFFTLTISTSSAVFAGLLILAVFVYRPVCRGFCPFGLLFSVAAHFSRYRLRRTDACISCRKCEKACPVNAAARGASKRECYLCARCTGVCPAEGALHYSTD